MKEIYIRRSPTEKVEREDPLLYGLAGSGPETVEEIHRGVETALPIHRTPVKTIELFSPASQPRIRVCGKVFSSIHTRNITTNANSKEAKAQQKFINMHFSEFIA